MGKGPKRPAFHRCGDRKYIVLTVIPMTIMAMIRHWREIPQIIREGK